jgi:hypothetical protein
MKFIVMGVVVLVVVGAVVVVVVGEVVVGVVVLVVLGAVVVVGEVVVGVVVLVVVGAVVVVVVRVGVPLTWVNSYVTRPNADGVRRAYGEVKRRVPANGRLTST